MSAARLAYSGASRLLGVLAPLLLRRRVRSGKEDVSRLNERFARHLSPRPGGTLVWLHGASVGESLLLLAIGEALQARHPAISLLFTSQTQTSARLLAGRLPKRALHQVAPLDTPGAARRFISHWRPDLAVFAEGEIWPNLIAETARTDARLALVNARMGAGSRAGWTRWRGFARSLFSRFDVLVAADETTGAALQALSGKTVLMPGNLKAALPPPLADSAEAEQFRARFSGQRACLLAASTHPGEEDRLLEAWFQVEPRPALVLVPRHPERLDELEALLKARGVRFAVRSRDEGPSLETQVYLADTIGEMGLWLRVCDAVFLGGASVPGIGGHNPIEPLLLGKPIVSGPYHGNFDETFSALSAFGALSIAEGPDALPAALSAALYDPPRLDEAGRDAFLVSARRPLDVTLYALSALLERRTA